ncbi:glycosyltransferase family 4 protein [Orrella sp. JC864]|uniref:MraY family glycosyltransferase n=1 Tax=Orrella sp. JC864 TaxID=3120298 RepID=UPI003009A2C5
MIDSSPWMLWLGPAALAAWALTGLARRYALARNVMDVPNGRSSHSQPTPRGGGLGFVLAYLAALALLAPMGGWPAGQVWSLAAAGAWVAAVGALDDHRPVPARWRLLAHILGAALVLHGIGLPAALSGQHWLPGWLAAPVLVLALAWGLNLYNFMDGIDGLAAIEAVSVAGLGALLSAAAGAGLLAGLAGLLACTVLGFLPWNFPRARIFMGDGGSGFLGLMLGGLCLLAAAWSAELMWAWLILPGVFVADATVTLLRRLLRGEALHQAHRTHAYQYAARRWRSHPRVTLAALAINVLWLGPWAAAAAWGHVCGPLAWLAAYLPLVLLAVRLGAGRPEAPAAG